MMDSSNGLDDSNSSYGVQRRTMDFVIDDAISGLNMCLDDYEKKITKWSTTLEKLSCTVNDLPEEVRRGLKNILCDNEVYNFSADGESTVTINPLHIVNSLQVDSEKTHLQRLENNINKQINDLQQLHRKIKSELTVLRYSCEDMNKEANAKAGATILFRGKLERAEDELGSLQRKSQVIGKPKYTSMEVDSLNREKEDLQNDVAILRTKLTKYNGLPVDQSSAEKVFKELKDDFGKLNIKINELVNSM